ncbi:MAG: anhydro-N-acetylmuramic acid kinase [Rhodobacteraceae bacterium]|nr:anhydro-N-acetylmuramic acid kinase [Paracoccaceae bacterium]
MTKGQPLRVIGTMSGTSLDGVDAAVVVTDGITVFEHGETGYRPYSEREQQVLRAALGTWPNAPEAKAAAEVVETAHAELLSGFDKADAVGFHGQTLAHDPHGRGTHQAGNGALLAEVLEVPVVWDFRSADVGMGGQGAPLAPFYHFAVAKQVGAKRPVAFLNLGGVGNLTWVDASKDAPEDEGALLAFDTGPANAPIDDLVQARLGKSRDQAGALAAQGHADEAMIAHALEAGYFLKMPPKSLDRNDFSEMSEAVRDLKTEDAAATLTEFAARAVAEGLKQCPAMPSQVVVSGGGRNNATMMSTLGAVCPAEVVPIEELGLDGDMIEAQAFAYLAARVMYGLPTSAPGTTGVATPIGGGTISRPGALGHLGISNSGAASSKPSN